MHAFLQKCIAFLLFLRIIKVQTRFVQLLLQNELLYRRMYMLYLALIAFGFLVGWMVREQSLTNQEKDQYNAFYHAEYAHPVVTD